MKNLACPLCGGECIDTDYSFCRDCGEFVEFETVEQDGCAKKRVSAVERFIDALISEGQEKVFTQFFAIMAVLVVIASIAENATHTLVLACLFALLSAMTWKFSKKVEIK